MYSPLPRRAMQHLAKGIAVCLLCSAMLFTKAQQTADTLTLDIPGAEKLFLQKNLTLLAARYNVDAQRALIQQARLWDNPYLTTDQNLYDQQGKFFAHNKNYGQVYIQASQLIRTAGKLSKLAQLSEDNTGLAQAQFSDVLRTLRYTLINDMLEVNNLLQNQQVYSRQLTELSRLQTGMKAQLNIGNISVKDYTRVEALIFGLRNEVGILQSKLIPYQQELKLLVGITDSSTFIKPQILYDYSRYDNVPLPSQISLIDTAKAYRPDLAIQQNQLLYANDNVTYQKALAKPDITAGFSFDQRSSYAPNYVGLQVGLPIPLFNRNQGNIKSAQIQVKQQETNVDAVNGRIGGEVESAVKLVRFYQALNNKEQQDLANQYDLLLNNVIKVYGERQIGLLEFIDFIDTYKETQLKLIAQRINLVQAVAQLNFTINKDILPIQ